MDMTVARTLQELSIDLYQSIIPRELDLGEPLAPKAGNLVKVIIGMRRSGKSYRLLQEMARRRLRRPLNIFTALKSASGTERFPRPYFMRALSSPASSSKLTP